MSAGKDDVDGLILWREYEVYCRTHLGVPSEYDDWITDNHLEKRSQPRKRNNNYDSQEF